MKKNKLNKLKEKVRLEISRKLSKETKVKIGKSMNGKHNSTNTEFKKGCIPWNKGLHIWEGKEHPRGMLGKHFSEEHKQKIGDKIRGKILLDKTKEQISHTRKELFKYGILKSPMQDKHHSQEAKNKISKIHKGRISPAKGRKFPKELYPNKGLRKTRKDIIIPMNDTKIEVKIQSFLSLLHIEFFTHKYISEISHAYQCDILIPKQETEGVIISQKTIIECDGCFFHDCPICKNKEYEWTIKRRGIDKIRTKELIDKGYNVIRLWEHEIKAMELNKFRSILK